ncbi:MAG TPA: hypothetical protein VL283_03255, partial [Candidatus Baltobacteraceae bacterium]|nr:hypothetical protein [Candidatus Baltobacteraceae bacterium]
RGEEETGSDVCAPGELDDAMACARANCGGVPDVDASRCAADACQIEAIGIYAHARGCFNCLVASAGKSLDEIAATCDGGPGASRLYGGENGVLLASRFPLIDVEALRLPSSGANRVALFATIEAPGGFTIEVVCTHLSSSNLIPPTDPRFATWAEEQLAQVDLIEDRLRARSGGRLSLLMGDLNSGPEVEGHLEATDVEAWDALTDFGFGDPAADADPPVCSRCEGNLLNPTENHLLIDHVMTLDAPAVEWKPLCAHAVMNEPVTVTDAGGASVSTSMSDHFGTLVKLDIK